MNNEGEPLIEGAPLDYDILRHAIPRLWQRPSGGEPVMSLELHAGPYKGVVFAFTKFEVQNVVFENGMSPTKYETEVFQSPPGFVKDEAFDRYTTELLLAWLAHTQQHDYRIIRSLRPRGKVQ